MGTRFATAFGLSALASISAAQYDGNYTVSGQITFASNPNLTVGASGPTPDSGNYLTEVGPYATGGGSYSYSGGTLSGSGAASLSAVSSNFSDDVAFVADYDIDYSITNATSQTQYITFTISESTSADVTTTIDPFGTVPGVGAVGSVEADLTEESNQTPFIFNSGSSVAVGAVSFYTLGVGWDNNGTLFDNYVTEQYTTTAFPDTLSFTQSYTDTFTCPIDADSTATMIFGVGSAGTASSVDALPPPPPTTPGPVAALPFLVGLVRRKRR